MLGVASRDLGSLISLGRTRRLSRRSCSIILSFPASRCSSASSAPGGAGDPSSTSEPCPAARSACRPSIKVCVFVCVCCVIVKFVAEVHQNLSNVGEHILTMFAKFIEISRSEKCIRRVQKCANTVDLKKCCKMSIHTLPLGGTHKYQV